MLPYANTCIDEAKGERRFCCEAEACAVGWRRAKRRSEFAALRPHAACLPS